MISKTIMEIKTYQQAHYCLEPVPNLQNFFLNLKYLEDDECYKRSLLIEARSSGTLSLLFYIISYILFGINPIYQQEGPMIHRIHYPTHEHGPLRRPPKCPIKSMSVFDFLGARFLLYLITSCYSFLSLYYLFDQNYTLPFNKQTTIGTMLQNLCNQYDEGDLMLVIAPSHKSCGEVLDKDKSLKDVKVDPHVCLYSLLL